MNHPVFFTMFRKKGLQYKNVIHNRWIKYQSSQQTATWRLTFQTERTASLYVTTSQTLAFPRFSTANRELSTIPRPTAKLIFVEKLISYKRSGLNATAAYKKSRMSLLRVSIVNNLEVTGNFSNFYNPEYFYKA